MVGLSQLRRGRVGGPNAGEPRTQEALEGRADVVFFDVSCQNMMRTWEDADLNVARAEAFGDAPGVGDRAGAIPGAVKNEGRAGDLREAIAEAHGGAL